ncbi:MAG: radical SAM protein [Candidatus Hodarchaeota archaeon]
MVNILITMRCNRACNYCFAREKIYSYANKNCQLDITIPNLDKVLNFLANNNCNIIQLAGGEPTIHSKFDEILIKTLKQGFHVNILSNSLWTKDNNNLFSSVPPTKINFLLNIDHPDTYSSSNWARIENNLSCLQGIHNVTLSFNIFERTPKADYIFDLVSKYNFTNLRLSFSMPVVFGGSINRSLPIEDYKYLAPFVEDFISEADNLGASVKMDNTVPICMFSKDQLADFLLNGVLDLNNNFTCRPAIDIGPDLLVWRCFGTSGLFNRKLDEFNSLFDIYEYFERVFKPYRFEVLPMDECYECGYAKDEICQGGCHGYSIARCTEKNDCPEMITDEILLNQRVRLSKSISMRKFQIPRETHLLLLENNVIMEIDPSLKSLLELLDGTRTINEVISTLMQEKTVINSNEDPLDSFLVNTVSQKFIPTLRRLIEMRCLVST